MKDIISEFKEHIVLYQTIEENIVSLINGTFPQIIVERKYTNEEVCLEKNYLSIFFLMVYQKLGLSKEKILFYGTINYLVRGIVTCSDNVLDHEDKFLLNIKNIEEKASTSQSIFLLIMYQTLLDTYFDIKIKEGTLLPEEKNKIYNHLFTELFEIGFMESIEETNKGDILPANEIFEKVNNYRGGRLLELAFLSQSVLEKNTETIEKARAAISCIGSGLQIMDDISDIKKDVQEKKRNYFISFLAEKYSLDYSMLGSVVNAPDFEKHYTTDIMLLYQKVLEVVEKGLEMLKTIGIDISLFEVQDLIKFIVKSRNMQGAFANMFGE
jgi:hypothetical protein